MLINFSFFYFNLFYVTFFFILLLLKCKLLCRDVAQFGSALHLGCKGRRFESCHPEGEVPGAGEVSEWFKVLVLKTSVTKVTEGSNPSFSVTNFGNLVYFDLVLRFNLIVINYISFKIILFSFKFSIKVLIGVRDLFVVISNIIWCLLLSYFSI